MSIVVKGRCSVCHPEKVTNKPWDMCDKCNDEKMKNIMHKSVRDVKARPVDIKLTADYLNKKAFVEEAEKEIGHCITPPLPKLELPKTSGGKSKYHREILPNVWVDVYDVLDAFGVSDAGYQHAIKKMLATGKRGHKSEVEDREDIMASVRRSNERFDLFNRGEE